MAADRMLADVAGVDSRTPVRHARGGSRAARTSWPIAGSSSARTRCPPTKPAHAPFRSKAGARAGRLGGSDGADPTCSTSTAAVEDGRAGTEARRGRRHRRLACPRERLSHVNILAGRARGCSRASLPEASIAWDTTTDVAVNFGTGPDVSRGLRRRCSRSAGARRPRRRADRERWVSCRTRSTSSLKLETRGRKAPRIAYSLDARVVTDQRSLRARMSRFAASHRVVGASRGDARAGPESTAHGERGAADRVEHRRRLQTSFAPRGLRWGIEALAPRRQRPGRSSGSSPAVVSVVDGRRRASRTYFSAWTAISSSRSCALVEPTTASTPSGAA